MLKIVSLVILVLVIGIIVYYFGFYKRGKINDRDGDYIPDEIEDTIKETKRRAKAVKKELKDVAVATKDVISQAGDVVEAVKGKKRRGRKPKAKK
tara:strand:+ start:199 stop:483 length:285 start_codon:yes stop_codon:yes gene_type:complete